jgi:hypothetical protein
MLLIQVDERLGLMLAVDEPLGSLSPETAAKAAGWGDEYRNDPSSGASCYPTEIKAVAMISVEVDTRKDTLLADIERYTKMAVPPDVRLAFISGALSLYNRP